jgi:hypothetical protein
MVVIVPYSRSKKIKNCIFAASLKQISKEVRKFICTRSTHEAIKRYLKKQLNMLCVVATADLTPKKSPKSRKAILWKEVDMADLKNERKF